MNADLIHQKIQTISVESGTHFFALYNIFPKLIEEINLQNNKKLKSDSKLFEFQRIQKALEETMEKRQRLLDENSQFMAVFRRKNRELFQSFAGGIDLLENINDVTLKIKDESQEMEVLSLNAIVVSIKSGKEGQAFSYITSNLKRFSFQLIMQSERLIGIDEQVQKDIRELKKLTDIGVIDDGDQNAEQTEISKNLHSAFLTVEQEIASMLETAHTVRKPLLRAMEGIQMQDLIRQSLDDVDLAVAKIRSHSSTVVTPEEQLDRINGNMQLVKVAKGCLISIAFKLKNSISVFTENRTLINNILEKIDGMRLQLFEKRGQDEVVSSRSDIETFQLCIQQSIQGFNKSMDTIQSYQDIQENVLIHSKKIQIKVKDIQSCFDEFSPIIGNLMYVTVAQRIEVARTDAISSIHNTVEDMANLIEQTRKNVDQAQKELRKFKNISSAQVVHFTEETNKNKTWFSKILAEKNNFSAEMQQLEEDMVTVMKQFTVYSDSFITQYTETGKRIKNLEDLLELLDSLQIDLTEVNVEFKKEKDRLLQTYRIADKPVYNSDIIEFLNHFTIIEDKQHAGSVVGLEVEQGTESGDITFF